MKQHTHCITEIYGSSVDEIASAIHIGEAFISINKKYKPKIKELKAIWDTGATGTSISSNIAKILQLQAISAVKIQGVTGYEICNTYYVSLHFPNGLIIPQIEVSEISFDIGCDVLLGMDVITMGDFAVTNLYGNTIFSFRVPSLEIIDFAKR